jgi:gliding motility-associated lipoprotein GldH
MNKIMMKLYELRNGVLRLMGLIGVIAFSSCTGNIYSHEEQLAEDTWGYNDSLTYTFSIPDTAQLYTMELDVKHTDAFPFENCYVKIKSRYPDKTTKVDVLSMNLPTFRQLDGEKSGDYLLAPIAIQPVAKFKEKGTYSMTFFQNTRRDSLPGIHSLKLKINKLKKN